MTPNPRIILTAPPAQVQPALAAGLPVAHMAYRLGDGPRLCRCTIPPAVRGGLMMMDDTGFQLMRGNFASFLREVSQECAARGYTGIIANWELPPSSTLAELMAALEELALKRGWTFFVPEAYAGQCTHAQVMISSAISGGSLQLRLQEACARWGKERITLAVERVAEDFTLPAPNGMGRPLTQEELSQLARRYHSASYFSRELCAHYFTYRPQEGGVHFVLYDDQGSIRKKLQIARALHLQYAIMAYPEVADLLPGILR